jgi:spore coat polysaccharide biosynthesis protein SpsF
MTVAAIISARMSSRRMPGKVLAPLAGAPAIVRMVERARRATLLDAVIVATSIDPSDDPLVEILSAASIPHHRGSLDDVLDRFVAALPAGATAAIRLTGDCPLIDPGIVDRAIARYFEEQPWADYVTNAVVRTHPDGLDVEVIRPSLLRRAAREATSAWDREHVTPWIQRRARIVPIADDVDRSRLRWTLDTPADYAFIAAIYDALHGACPAFSTADVLALLEARPELARIGGST